VDSEFIRFPLSLLANPKYREMSLESKVVYSLLLNRLTLSQKNGWINEKRKVYLIFTREETAETLNITYKKAISAFKELISRNLIIEHRRGKGFANIIYLVKTNLSDNDAVEFSSRFETENADTEAETTENTQTCQNSTSRHAETAVQDIPNGQLKDCQNGTSGHVKAAVQDMPKEHTSNINKNNTYVSQNNISQTVGLEAVIPSDFISKPNTTESDDIVLSLIFEKCGFENYADVHVNIFKNVIERLYYSKRFKVGDAVLPQSRVRSYLHRIDSEVISETHAILELYRGSVTNATGYIMSVLFNQICEKDSTKLIHQPIGYEGGAP